MSRRKAVQATAWVGTAFFAGLGQAAPPPSALEVPGWTAMLDDLRDLPARILSKLPPEQRDDPQIRQEVGWWALAAVTSGMLDRPVELRAEGYVAKLKDVDFTQLGGLAGQYYYEGIYNLRDDEALIVETRMPDKCANRSLILTNAIYKTTDWYNNQSSLNAAQAHGDKYGVLCIVVSARDPGVANWLDTAGYRSGVIQGRWLDCSSKPTPRVCQVPVADVRKFLPAGTDIVTPEERDRQIRSRRAALQQRPLW